MRDEVWALPGKQVVEGVRWAVCRRVSAGGAIRQCGPSTCSWRWGAPIACAELRAGEDCAEKHPGPEGPWSSLW